MEFETLPVTLRQTDSEREFKLPLLCRMRIAYFERIVTRRNFVTQENV